MIDEVAITCVRLIFHDLKNRNAVPRHGISKLSSGRRFHYMGIAAALSASRSKNERIKCGMTV